jgi:cell division septation protein DedD
MIRGSASKRKLGDVWPQLMLSAGVLLVPPLAIMAFVVQFSLPSSQVVGLHVTEGADERQIATNFPLASAEQDPVIIERRRVADGPAAGTLSQATKDATRYTSEQSVMAQIMAPSDISAQEQQPDARRRSPPRATASLAIPQTARAAIDESHPSPSGRRTPTTHDTGAWVVQLSAQKTEEEAQSAYRSAQAKFSALASYQLLLRKKDQGERGTFYAAQVGPLARSEASELCDRLKSAGASCFIERSLP